MFWTPAIRRTGGHMRNAAHHLRFWVLTGLLVATLAALPAVPHATPRDLAGKRIGVSLGTSGEYFLWAFLVRNRLDFLLVGGSGFLQAHPQVAQKLARTLLQTEQYQRLYLDALLAVQPERVTPVR